MSVEEIVIAIVIAAVRRQTGPAQMRMADTDEIARAEAMRCAMWWIWYRADCQFGGFPSPAKSGWRHGYWDWVSRVRGVS